MATPAGLIPGIRQKMNSMIDLCARSAALAAGHLKALEHPPAILSHVLIECSSLKAACESIAFLHEHGNLPTHLLQILEEPDNSLLGACTSALDDLDGLLEPYAEPTAGSSRVPAGELTHLHTLIDSVLALKAAISATASSGQPYRTPNGSDGITTCLGGFQLVTDAVFVEHLLGHEYYTERQTDTFKHAVGGTGQWFLDSAEFCTWVSGKSQTLYCPGIPGSGKTTLTSIAVDHVRRRFQHDHSVGVAFLYLDYEDSSVRYSGGLRAILKILLRQFLEYDRDRPYSAAFHALGKRHARFHSKPSAEELLEVLRTVMGEYSKTYILVDSLHMMTPMSHSSIGPGDVVGLLSPLQDCLGTNVLFTSRPIPTADKHFVEAPTLEIRAKEEDLRLFLDNRMTRLPGWIQRDAKRREEVKDRIVSKADGMFGLAAHYIRGLQSACRSGDVEDVFDDVPDCTEDLYREELERIEDMYKGEGGIALRALSWVTSAKRPLTATQLQHALAVDDWGWRDQELFPPIEDFITACNGLLKVDEETRLVSVAHWSLEECQHITNPERESRAKECIAYLTATALSGPCKSDAELHERLAKYPFYQYAAEFWATHILNCKHSAQTLPSFYSFLGGNDKLSPQAEAAFQVMFVGKRDNAPEGYSQEFPRQMTGLHLAAYCGLKQLTNMIVTAMPENVRYPAPRPLPPGWTPPPDWTPSLPRRARILDSYGRSPLWYAADRGHLSTVEELVNWQRLDPYLADKDGETPVSRAWARGCGHWVGMMLKNEYRSGTGDVAVSKLISLVNRPVPGADGDTIDGATADEE